MSGSSPRPLSPARLSALTDGIFAIAMTLLVLNLTVPELPAATAAAQLPQSLLALWPKLLSYGLS
ncbi:MAG TPA: TMEM175 family protein, partial [Thermomicrobiales bacterium]|nr:TMEM175 family protein [Thermomicrobiales bacterium]